MDLDQLAGTTLAIAGFSKGSGKTTFLGWLMPLLRKHGPLALFSIGLDGEYKAQAGSRPLYVEPGDVVLTTEHLAKAASARLEVLETLGNSALGRLFLGRAVRGGSVTLVGCPMGTLAATIARVKEEAWAVSSLVDGAVNRLTQLSALHDNDRFGFIYTLKAEPSNLPQVSRKVRELTRLSELPQIATPPPAHFTLNDALTKNTLEKIPDGTSHLCVDDFTKIFLEGAALDQVLARYQIFVRHPIRLHGFSAILRGISRMAFQEAVKLPSDKLIFNPFELT